MRPAGPVCRFNSHSSGPGTCLHPSRTQGAKGRRLAPSRASQAPQGTASRQAQAQPAPGPRPAATGARGQAAFHTKSPCEVPAAGRPMAVRHSGQWPRHRRQHPCQSEHEHKQLETRHPQLQGSNTTGRRHRHTQGKQSDSSLPNFVSIDTGNAERESSSLPP